MKEMQAGILGQLQAHMVKKVAAAMTPESDPLPVSPLLDMDQLYLHPGGRAV